MSGYKTWMTDKIIETMPFTLEHAHECLWDYFCEQFEEMYGEQPDLDTPCEEYGGGTMRDYCIDCYSWYASDLWEEREEESPDKWSLSYSAGVWGGHIAEETEETFVAPFIVTV